MSSKITVDSDENALEKKSESPPGDPAESAPLNADQSNDSKTSSLGSAPLNADQSNDSKTSSHGSSDVSVSPGALLELSRDKRISEISTFSEGFNIEEPSDGPATTAYLNDVELLKKKLAELERKIREQEEFDEEKEDTDKEDTESERQRQRPILKLPFLKGERIQEPPLTDIRSKQAYVSDTVSFASFCKLQPRYDDTFSEENSKIESLKSLNISESSSSGTSPEDSGSRSSPSHVVSEEEEFNRELYLQLYKFHEQELIAATIKHKVLESRVADYYKKRRMFHVLYSDELPDQVTKYYMLLDELDEVYERCAQESATIKSQVDSLRRKCIEQNKSLNLLFEQLQKREETLFKDIMSTADSLTKGDLQKHIDRYLRRQKAQQNSLKSMRLDNIKLRNKYNEVKEELNSIECVSSDLRLMDYQQLKTDNRNLRDKNEEKGLELSNIRKKCQCTTQILAHMREKIYLMEASIKNLNDRFETLAFDSIFARDQLTQLKTSRDDYRRKIIDLRNEVGLLIRPKLLRDMEKTKIELRKGKFVLDGYEKEIEVTSGKIRAIKKKIYNMMNPEPSLLSLLSLKNVKKNASKESS